jgi:hypothetical protein
VQSWIDIAFDNLGHKQMFINFPKYNTSQIRACFSPQVTLAHQFKSTYEIDSFVATTLLELITPLSDDEFHFLEQISEILRRIISGEVLSDSQKHIFSMEEPFPTLPDLHLSSAYSTQSMYELRELTEEQKVTDSEVVSCCSVTIPPFEIQTNVDDIQRSIIADTQKKLNKNQKKKIRKAKRKSTEDEDLEGVKDMLHRYSLRNKLIVLSEDPTQMQKTINHAM